MVKPDLPSAKKTAAQKDERQDWSVFASFPQVCKVAILGVNTLTSLHPL